MATSAPLSENKKVEKAPKSTIPLKQGAIRVAMTLTFAPSWAGELPFTGNSTGAASQPSGVCEQSGISDVCLGTAIFESHGLASVRRKDASFESKRREKFIFLLVPKADIPDERGELLLRAEASLRDELALETFNQAMVFNNGDYGMMVEFRGQAKRQNANKSFVVA